MTFLSPTAIPPALAKAMVLRTQAPHNVPIVDPFCGTGIILEQATALGYKTIGYDIDSSALAHAKKRVPSAKLFCQDARTIDMPLFAVVTDIPYGKSTSVQSLVFLYAAFLKQARPLLHGVMVISFPSFLSGKRIASLSGYTIVSSDAQYVHRSLSREIFILI